MLIAVAALVPSLCAQSGTFTIAQHGHAVGTATVNVTAAPQGYTTTSVVRVAMQGLNYNLSETQQLTSANAIKHVQLSATVNGSAVTVTAAPDAAQFLLNISANGRSTTTRLAEHGRRLPPRLRPRRAGNAARPRRSPQQRRSLGHRPQECRLHRAHPTRHLRRRTGHPRRQAHRRSSPCCHHRRRGYRPLLRPASQLLQAELPQNGFALVRKGFILTPPAKPGAPPAAQ